MFSFNKNVSRKKVDRKAKKKKDDPIVCGDRVIINDGPYKGKTGSCYNIKLMGDYDVEMDDTSLGILNFCNKLVEHLGVSDD